MVSLILIFSALLVVIIVVASIRYFWLLLRPPKRQPLVLPRRTSIPAHPLRNRLLELCHGDSALVDRLYLSANRPGKSDEWIYQKAIDDLIRDRSR